MSCLPLGNKTYFLPPAPPRQDGVEYDFDLSSFMVPQATSERAIEVGTLIEQIDQTEEQKNSAVIALRVLGIAAAVSVGALILAGTIASAPLAILASLVAIISEVAFATMLIVIPEENLPSIGEFFAGRDVVSHENQVLAAREVLTDRIQDIYDQNTGALSLVKEVIEQFPEYYEAHPELGDIYLKQFEHLKSAYNTIQDGWDAWKAQEMLKVNEDF